MTTIMERLEEIAKPIIKAYHSDLTTHDRRAFERADPGDVLIWFPRECGTHMMWVTTKAGLDAESMAGNRGVFRYICQNYESPQFWKIDVGHDGGGKVQQVTTDCVERHFQRAYEINRKAREQAI